jgi:hypothetical protein
MVAWIRDFSSTVLARVGRLPAIYTTTDWWTRCTGNNAGFGANPLFIARYPSNIGSGAGTLPAGWSNYTLWQYASSGIFPGDQDTFNGGAPDLAAFASNGPTVQTMPSPLVGVGDFNGDGRPDFIARRSDGTLWFYAGTGSVTSYASDPGYRSAIQIGFGWGIYDELVGAGDLTGDGIPDLIARKPSGAVMLYSGTGKAGISGNEGYNAAVQVASGWDSYIELTAVGDFSGDAKPDLLGRKADGTLWLLAGTGRGAAGGTFQAPLQIGTNWSIFRTLLGIGDLDKDGKADLIGIQDDGSAAFYAGVGAPSYYKPSASITVPGITSTDVFATPGDMNGDGIPDLLDRSLSGTLMLIGGAQIPLEGYQAARPAGGKWTQITQLIAPGDFDGDGKPDVLTEAADGTLWFRGGMGSVDPAFGTAAKIGWGWNIYSSVVAGGDLNGDKHPDLLGIKPDGTLWFYAGTGAVNPSDSGYRPGIKIGWGWDTFRDVLGVGDLNGDGRSDLLAYRSDGSSVFYAGTGTVDSEHQGYRGGVALDSVFSPGAQLLAPRDFTGDRKVDVIARNAAGELWLYPGKGSVSSAGTAFDKSYRIGTGWSVFQTVVGVGDADGNGTSDLLAIHANGAATFYAGTGTAGKLYPGFLPPLINGTNWGIYR